MIRGWLASWPRGREPRRADPLWKRGGPPWETWRIKDTEKGPAVWDVRAVRFRPVEERKVGEEQWLIIARNALDHNEIKYFLSNASEDTPLRTLLHVAFARWHVERMFRESKNEAGLDHYEGRHYRGFRRHLLLTALSLLYLAEQKERLGAKKGAPESPSNRSSVPWKLNWTTPKRLGAAAAG